MSQFVTTHYVQQYTTNVQLLSQQKGSRLRNTVRTDATDGGKKLYFDRVGATSM